MTYRDTLTDLAFDRHGFVTTHDAHELGIPVVELGKMAARGGLDRVAYGVYRVPIVPVAEHDQYAEAVLRVGAGAYLTHDAVLALHGLGLVNPRRIRVGTRHRVRAGLPPFVQVVRQPDPPAADLTVYEGIRSTTVARAILDCQSMVMTDRLEQAVKDAAAQGLITPAQAGHLRRALRRQEPARAAHSR